MTRTARQFHTVASHEGAPPAPTLTTKVSAPDRRSSAPAQVNRQSSVAHRFTSSAPQSGNHDTMLYNAQSSATRSKQRDPAADCALAKPRRITRHCVWLPPPVRWRLRSCLTAPREAQAARPPGTAPKCSRHASGQPPSPRRCHAVCSRRPVQAATHRSGPCGCAVQAHHASPPTALHSSATPAAPPF